jgi:hypothetical protein
MSLPETVQPGELITAALLNDILAALRRLSELVQKQDDFDSRIDKLDRRVLAIEQLIKKLSDDNGIFKGRIDLIDANYLNLKPRVDFFEGKTIPDLRDDFTRFREVVNPQINDLISKINHVNIRTVAPTDPIDTLNMFDEGTRATLRSNGVLNISDFQQLDQPRINAIFPTNPVLAGALFDVQKNIRMP